MIRPGWTITFEGKAWCQSDLIVADAIRICETAGVTWPELHPLRHPSVFAVTLAVFLTYTGEDFDRALLRASALNMVEARSLVSIGEEAIDDGRPD